MAYDTSNLKAKAPGATQETSDAGSHDAGLYRHPETGNEIITLYDPLFGNAQSDGVVRLGFERVGDAPEGSIKTIVEQNKNDRVYNQTTVASDKARLDALELDSLRREKAEREAKEAEVTTTTAPEVKIKKESK